MPQFISLYAVNNVFHIGSNVSVFLFFVWLFPPGKVNIMLLLYYFYQLYIDYVRKV
jgi:hypothetical protein